MTLQNFVDPAWINPKKVDRLQTRYEASSAPVVQPVPLAASPCKWGGGMGVQTGTMARWYVQRPGYASVGPIDAAELRRAWQRQEIASGTMVCAEGSNEWAAFHTIPELVEACPTDAEPPRGGLPPHSGKRGGRGRLIGLIVGRAKNRLGAYVLSGQKFYILNNQVAHVEP